MVTQESKPLQRISQRNWVNRIVLGDSRKVLQRLPDACVDLVVTSPPYADQRMQSYGGVRPDHYVEWFMPIAQELHRVLKNDGSFILNIKERAVDGERHTYVLELILAMRKIGWRWTEEYIWSKQNSFPGKWPNRFRDAWERCLHFTKQADFVMHQEAVMVPVGDWHRERFKSPSKADSKRPASKVGNTLSRRVANWSDRSLAFPTNVLSLPTECRNRGHAAAFPTSLPSWFIKLLTLPGEIVMDPFVGSGTTAVAAKELDRRYVGVELSPIYAAAAAKRVAQAQNSEVETHREGPRAAPRTAGQVSSKQSGIASKPPRAA